MSKISLKQLQAFVSVADLASFRRAAEFLNTTQPNISSRIRALEEQLDQKLFVRDAGSVNLTNAGKLMLDKARVVLRSMESFLEASGNDQVFEGVLRLGVTEMVAHSWLGRFLSALRERYPNIDVELTVDVSDNISKALFDRAIDLALQSGPFERAISGDIELGEFPLIWVASPALNLENGTLSLEDLTTNPILTHANRTLPYTQLRHHLESYAKGPVKLVPSTHLAACLQMAMDGIGVACLPTAMVQHAVESGSLIELNYHWVPDALRFYARFEAEIAPAYVKSSALLAQEVCGVGV